MTLVPVCQKRSVMPRVSAKRFPACLQSRAPESIKPDEPSGLTGRTGMRIWPGRPYPLGATWDGEGVNFALFSENATGVELCLFEGSKGNDEMGRVRVTEQTDLVWHVYIP